MKRRAFLGAAAASVLGLMVRRAFGDSSLPGKKGDSSSAVQKVDLEAALARAARAGVPLFAIVIPQDDGKKWEVGRAWGELLNHGKPEQVAPLSRAEVVCAPMDELAKITIPGISGAEPLALVIEPSSRKVTQVLHATLPAYEERYRVIVVGNGKEKAPKPRPDDEVTDERIATMAGLVRSGLPGTPAMLTVETANMAQVVKTKLIDRPPPGAHWANASGCGPARVEQTPEEKEAERKAEEADRKKGIFRMKSVVAYGCGMGHVPQKSTRFLHFFAKLDEA
jgi:hypothetical protein